ncbi:MAG: thioredoxin domain-containing protein [Patescibacteria group bacterium]|nr:thioredoxin domain-containing protein [Patescibacteria group bacterium]
MEDKKKKNEWEGEEKNKNKKETEIDDLEDDDWDDDFDDWDDDQDDDQGKNKGPEKKKAQNYLAAIIILAGLFTGSLFVDAFQLVKGQGISSKKLSGIDVFSLNGKTWVSNNDPVVELTVITDDACEECQPEPVIEAVKKTAVPTAVVKKINIDDPKARELIEQFNLKSIPAFIFNDKIKETEFYAQAQMVLKEKQGSFLIDNALAGIPSGKFIALPEPSSATPSRGNQDAPVKVMIFSDFQCPYCKKFDETFNKVFAKYQDKMQVSFRQLPLSNIHPQAYPAALASLCANEQEKFWEMYDTLFSNQDEWGKNEADKTVFTKYAGAISIDADKFKKCMDDETYAPIIEQDEKTAQEFGLSGTPSIFINDEFVSGAISEQDLAEIIEKQLAK